jgi:hypothetical protein
MDGTADTNEGRSLEYGLVLGVLAAGMPPGLPRRPAITASFVPDDFSGSNDQASFCPVNVNLADCDLVFGPVVELRGPGRLLPRHLLGILEFRSTR